MSYASLLNIVTIKFTKFTIKSPESIPKRRLLNKARPPHRNNNNKTCAENSQCSRMVLYIGFTSLTKCREYTETSHTASIKKQLPSLRANEIC